MCARLLIGCFFPRFALRLFHRRSWLGDLRFVVGCAVFVAGQTRRGKEEGGGREGKEERGKGAGGRGKGKGGKGERGRAERGGGEGESRKERARDAEKKRPGIDHILLNFPRIFHACFNCLVSRDVAS